jgi:hypothetical protein
MPASWSSRPVLVQAIPLRVGMTIHGPKTDLFVDRATCSVTSP